MRYSLLFAFALMPLCAVQAQQTKPTQRSAAGSKSTKSKPAPASAATRATDDATVAPGETVELGRASTDYNGRPSTYKKPARALPPTDSPMLPGGQGLNAAPGQPVQPVERARDDYEGRPVAPKTKPAHSTTQAKPAKN